MGRKLPLPVPDRGAEVAQASRKAQAPFLSTRGRGEGWLKDMTGRCDKVQMACHIGPTAPPASGAQHVYSRARSAPPPDLQRAALRTLQYPTRNARRSTLWWSVTAPDRRRTNHRCACRALAEARSGRVRGT